jgi:hypothetical protein
MTEVGLSLGGAGFGGGACLVSFALEGMGEVFLSDFNAIVIKQ